jgi:hypothetical protein
VVSEARGQLRAEAQALGDVMLNLEPLITLHPDARLDYDTAVSRFKAAVASIDSVRSVWRTPARPPVRRRMGRRQSRRRRLDAGGGDLAAAALAEAGISAAGNQSVS